MTRPMARATRQIRLWNRAARLVAICAAAGLALAAPWGPATAQGAAQPAPSGDAPAPAGLPGTGIAPELQIRGGVSDTPAIEIPAAPANTTVVPRNAPGPPTGNTNGDTTGNTSGTAKAGAGKAAPGARAARLTLTALLSDEGQQIEQGLVWRVFEDAAGKTKPLHASREAMPQFALAPGAYVVNVAFGRANLTRKIVVKSGVPSSETFVLNAGGLRLEAVLDKNQKPQPNAIAYDIFSDERDQSGNRTRIMTAARPGLIVRLNAGIYHIVSTYGDANASVATDITVEAGKLTQVRVLHSAARVTFKLVSRAGGDALAGTQWLLMTPQGEHVKESVGALPSHIIAPGAYVIVAKQGGKAFRRNFAVQAGDIAQVEVVMQ